MAYMIGNEGPLPNLPDEFCGNVTLGCYKCHKYGEAHDVFGDKRPGRPRPVGAQTTEALEAAGIVGLYLTDVTPIRHADYRITKLATPDELREPPECV